MKIRLFANPTIAVELTYGFVAITTLMVLVVLFNSVRNDDWVLDHLNALVSLLLSVLIVHRLSLGVKSRLATLAWIATFAIIVVFGITQVFEDYTDRLQRLLHIEDLDNLFAWPAAPIGLLIASRFDRIGRWPLRILFAGFCAQSASNILDLLDGWLTHSLGYDFDLMEVLVDFSQFVFLQFYLIGLTLFVASLYVLQEPAGTAPGMVESGLWLMRGELRWQIWRLRNSKRPFSAFYTDRIAGKLDRGIAHSTLGARDRNAAGVSTPTTEAGCWKRGIGTFGFLRSLGIDPTQRCLDYGCGSLRIGMHFIDYLEPGNYWGVDVTDRFYEDGRALLNPEFTRDKAPRFGVISDATLEAVRHWKPDIVFSVSVLMHVPPAEVDRYFQRILGMLNGGAKAIILFDRTARNKRIAPLAWGYTECFLRERILHLDPQAEISCRFYENIGHGIRRFSLIVTRR
jgi:hypothetical protein